MFSRESVVCRVCFTTNVKMHCIGDIGLQEIYERIACAELNTDDGSPNTLCYICSSQLQKCFRFSQMTMRAEKMLTELVKAPTMQSAILEKPIMLQNLTLTPVKHLAVNDDESTAISANVEHKDVESPLVSVKVEVQDVDEPDDIIDIGKIWINVEIPPKPEVTNFHDNLSLQSETNESYTCNDCGTEFSEKRHLRYHMKTHLENNVHSCTKCNKTFLDISRYRKHVKTHNHRPYACTRCSKAFLHNNALQTHIRTHTGQQPFACKLCERTFSDNSNYQRHMRIHTGAKPHLCGQCSKTFRRQGDLQNHITSVHTNDRPFICEQCNKTFSIGSSYLRHLRIHSGYKPYICNQCEMRFLRISGLERHIRNHSGEKRYVCSECPKAFFDNSSYERHFKVHTKDKPIEK